MTALRGTCVCAQPEQFRRSAEVGRRGLKSRWRAAILAAHAIACARAHEPSDENGLVEGEIAGSGGAEAAADGGDRGVDTAGADGIPSLDEGDGDATELGEEAGDSEADDSEVGEGADPRFDLGSVPDTPAVDPPEEFSYIWIANSPQGTISKIDTRTLVEVGRYFTGPEGRRDPSRTSVNLAGDMAVVNRDGGATMIFAREADCIDRNGDGAIQSSSGAGDVLAWGEDECVHWHLELGQGSRPAAWTAGTRLPNGKVVDAKLWLSYAEASPGDPPGGPYGVRVVLVDGATGTIENQQVVPAAASSGYGVYGAAVDRRNDFWGTSLTYTPGGANLIHVPLDDPAAHEVINIPGGESYGITVDARGRVWVGSMNDPDTPASPNRLQRYDPSDGRWTTVDVSGIPGTGQWWVRGMSVDRDGELWAAVVGPSGLLRVDTDAATVTEFFDYTRLMVGGKGVSGPTGTSIDFDGKIWLVDQGANGAFALDKQTMQLEFVGDLEAPYTYSDMTGGALFNVTEDPPERR